MKRFLTILIILLSVKASYGDVAFMPYPFAFFCYSGEFIYSYEIVKNDRNSTSFWGGAGCVGSFLYPDVPPALGLELAIEKRHYFKPDIHRHFFISAYLGAACMIDSEDEKYLGIIPGLKINYKAQISKIIILEPYLSLSVPFYANLTQISQYPPYPVLTFGVRLGLSKLRR